MFKLINVTAVPFQLPRLQSSAPKNIFQRTTEIIANQSLNNGVPILTSIQNINIPQINTNTTPSRTLNDRIMKKRNKVLKNRLAAKVSREKWRLHKDLLEQQLQNLKMEKMRLLMENEELRLQHNHLKEENFSLTQNFVENQEKRNDVCEDTLRHAEGMGSSTPLHNLLDDTKRDFQQLPVATVPKDPLLEDFPDFEQLFQFSDASDFYEEPDVFVCSLSQDVTKETVHHDATAVARTVYQEIEVSCMEEMSSSLDIMSSDQDRNSDETVEFAENFPSYPELWTFDDLYDDMDDDFTSLFQSL